MASIRKRTGQDGSISFRVEICLKSFKRQSATFQPSTDTKKWASSTESAIREGRYFKIAEARKHTLSEVISRYIKEVLPNKKSYGANIQKTQLHWWEEQLGHNILGDVTPALIAESRDRLKSEAEYKNKYRSSATVNRYLAALSHVFTITVNEWGWLDDSPMRKVNKLKEPSGRIRFLSDDKTEHGKSTPSERTKLLQECWESVNKDLHTIVVLALSTGMRFGEIMSLHWSQVDKGRKKITLYEIKNGEIRTVPLTGLAYELVDIRSKIGAIDTNLLFPSGNNRNKPIDIRGSWNFVLKRAQIEDFRFHDLRHSAASYLAMNGASLTDIAAILGHKTLQMVQRYAHLSEDHKLSVVSSMNDKIFN